MEMKDNIRSGLTLVGDAVSEIATSIAEKNRLRTQLNHIKGLIKSDSATRDQAYIELGRFFYENLREGASPENEAICAVVDAASERISAASVRYMELLNIQNEIKIGAENTEKLKKIIAEKADFAAKAAKDKGTELAAKAKDAAADAVVKAKEAAEKAKLAASELKDKAADTVEDVRGRFAAEDGVEEIIAEEQAKTEAEAPAEPEEPAAPAEESPESFEF